MDMIKNSWLIILMLRKAPSIIIINNKNNNNNNNNNIIIIIMHLDGPQVPQPRLAQAAVRHVPPPAAVLGDLPPDYNVYKYDNNNIYIYIICIIIYSRNAPRPRSWGSPT